MEAWMQKQGYYGWYENLSWSYDTRTNTLTTTMGELTCKAEIVYSTNWDIVLKGHVAGITETTTDESGKVVPVSDVELIPFRFANSINLGRDEALGETVSLTRETFLSDSALRSRMFPNTDNEEIVLPRQEMSDCSDYLNAVIFNSVNVRYYTKQILRDVSWVVRRNDKWALLGKNGCGKSTLLSLICGDNPQGYANDITLFDRKRGTGESIWDIKSHIGYLSPDMHTYYRENISCEDVVSSGFFDQIGLYRKPNDLQRAMARRWLKTFHAEDIADKPFLSSSFGEQRLALLVRAFVKSPSLLILDEPLHGLDESKKRIAKRVVEQYCREKNATLIYVTHYEEEIPECVTERKTLVKPE
jgi:molybdate transport system ATP-binding protein